VLTVAPGGEVMVSVGGAAAIVILICPLVLPPGLLASVALIVRSEVPATVGVPLTRQFAPMTSPAGNAPAVTEHA
jgi:hypothetical protein